MKKILDHDSVVEGKKYKVIKIPPFWQTMVNTGCHYPFLNKLGIVKWKSKTACLLKFQDYAADSVVPYDCIEEVDETPKELDGDVLLRKIIENPLGTLKLIRGLSKMTKHFDAKLFIEAGIIADAEKSK